MTLKQFSLESNRPGFGLFFYLLPVVYLLLNFLIYRMGLTPLGLRRQNLCGKVLTDVTGHAIEGSSAKGGIGTGSLGRDLA